MTRSPAKTHTIILLSLWGLAFLGVLYLGNQARKDVKIARSATGFHLGEPETIHTKGLSAESQLLLYGDPTQESNDARWKALPDSDPENPLFYLFYLQHADGIPGDFHQTVARIDPDNGWYSVWEVSVLEPAFEKSHRNKLQKSEREELINKEIPVPPRTFEFPDLDTFHQHVAILEKGLLAPRVDHYPREIASLRFNTLPSPYDFSSKINSLAIAVGSVGPVLAWKDGADLLCAALQIAESEEEFIRLEKLCLKLEEHLHKNSTTLLSALVYKAAVHVHSSSLRAAAERLDLTETEAFYRERQLRFQKESERQRLDKYDYATEKLLRERADLLTNLSMPPTRKILPDPPELTAEMLKPALRVERAVASRIFYSAFFIGLSLCGLIVWLRGRNRENPATFIPEIRILLFGSLLPFALLLIYRYFLSFGMLNFGGRSLTFWNYLLPEIAVFLILLVIPQVLMNKKTYPEHSFLRLWWPTGVAILGLLFASVMMHLLNLDYVAFILPGLFLTATLFWGLSQLRKPKPGFDRNGRIAPCYLLSATLCVLFIFGLVAEERFWFKQEGPHHASANGLTVFETETTEHLNEFVLQLRGPSRK